jgi:uncharacterized protein
VVPARNFRLNILAKVRSILRIASFLSILSYPTAATTVIDCSRARTNVEKLLCTSTELGQLDDQMVRAFRETFLRSKDQNALMDDQRNWVKTVRDNCNDSHCLRDAYAQRIEALQSR